MGVDSRPTKRLLTLLKNYSKVQHPRRPGSSIEHLRASFGSEGENESGHYFVSQLFHLTMTRHWQAEEITAACKGYAKATLNPRVGADKDFNAFSNEVLLRTEEFSPPEAQEGRFHHRSPRIYTYLRDRVFPTLQKFNKALRHIYSCNSTGVTEQEKINMAVALFLDKTTTMDYAFKNFNPLNWKHYGT